MGVYGVKRFRAYYFPVICICLGALIALFTGVYLQRRFSVQTVTPVEMQKSGTIILDAGHGGIDGGTSAKDGTVEKDINLAITLKLRDMLVLSGYQVVLTRDSDRSIHSDDATTIHQKKVSDLQNRLKIMQSYPNSLFISIHQNHYSESKYSGAQIFYSSNHLESEQLAQTLQNAFRDLLQPENSREVKPAGKDLYLMWNAEVPAVLAECGFLSNETESTLLSQDDYQQKVAFVLYCGILNYLQDMGTTPVTSQ